MTTLPFEVQCTHRAPLRAESRRRLRLVLGISAVVMVAEAVGGYAAGSLALLADAGHMLTDVAALGPALVVAHLCERPQGPDVREHVTDRKSTRLNSSHLLISYAVFCF